MWVNRSEELIFRRTDGSVWLSTNYTNSPNDFSRIVNETFGQRLGFIPAQDSAPYSSNVSPYRASCN